MLEVKNLRKKFGEVVAVDDLSFSVSKGEVVGLLGPNGAGKSTTMRMITGFLFPDRGNVWVEGMSIQEDDLETRRCIGYLPEDNPLYPEMLVTDFLNFCAGLKSIPKSEQKEAISAVVEPVGLERVFYRPIGELSKGYRQRVGLAQALLHKPAILILDEPTQGLDPNQQAEIRSLILELGQERTVILSTHVMQEVTAVCGRVLIINEGQLVADGTAQELSSQLGQGRILYLEIEGDQILPVLKDLQGVAAIEQVGGEGPRLHLELSLEKDIQLQPALSELIKKYGWVVWKLQEVEHGLEEVFKKLTKGE